MFSKLFYFRLAGQLDTTVENAMHLMFRRMDEQLLEAFIQFLFMYKASADVVCEVACSDAHPFVALFGMTVDSYVGMFIAISLDMGGVYYAMKLADRFDMGGVVLQIGYQHVLKEKVSGYKVVGKKGNVAVTERYCKLIY